MSHVQRVRTSDSDRLRPFAGIVSRMTHKPTAHKPCRGLPPIINKPQSYKTTLRYPLPTDKKESIGKDRAAQPRHGARIHPWRRDDQQKPQTSETEVCATLLGLAIPLTRSAPQTTLSPAGRGPKSSWLFNSVAIRNYSNAFPNTKGLR